MKKICTILILISFFIYQVANFLTVTLIHFVEKEKIEAHILRTVPESECDIISLNSSTPNLKWEEQDEIFTLNGEMYDVSKKKVINGKVYLYCLKEKKEMEILDDISLKISNGDYNGKHFNLPFSIDCIIIEKVNNTVIPFSPSVFSNLKVHTAGQIKNILIPPPRLLDRIDFQNC